MKELGIVGGLGPMATAYFMELIVKMTDAGCDREHIPMIIFNRPDVPDRTDFITGKSKDSPLDAIISTGQTLVRLGVNHIAIPCVTAHYFHEELVRNIKVPVINMPGETAEYLRENGVKKAGIMATDGTIFSGLFKRELEMRGIEAVMPQEKAQREVMRIIYEQIKANKPYDINSFNFVAGELRNAGAQVIILGCTELSLIKRDGRLGPGFIDVMEVLAAKAILMSGGKLKKEYISLIS